MLASTMGELSFERCGEELSTAVFACLREEFERASLPSISPDCTDSTDSASSFYKFFIDKSAASSPVLSSGSSTEIADLQGAAFSVAAPQNPGFFCSCSGENIISSFYFAAENAEHFSISVGLVPRPVPQRRAEKRHRSYPPGAFYRATFTSQVRRSMRL